MSENNNVNTESTETAQPVDPIVDFLSRVSIGNDLINDLMSVGTSYEKYQKYYRATDLFVLKSIIDNVVTYEDDKDNPNFIAFNNLLKWMMYLIATNPWWHRKLCYFNRMMGVNINSTSYWHLQYHPYYIPGQNWNDNLEQSPKEFNDSQMDQRQIYQWIDEQVDKIE